ncbi:MAG: fatty acid--CoA ligase family protein [Steroidobacteraceae bacterium]
MTGSGARPTGTLHGLGAEVPLARLAQASCLGGRLEELRGRVVMLAMRDQLTAALAMIELDGVAQRMVLCPPELSADHALAVARESGAQAWLGDVPAPDEAGLAVSLSVTAEPRACRAGLERRPSHLTEWILLTSATTGAPKLVQHTLASLTSAFAHEPLASGTVIWSTFYDIRRYGGLQIFLRALYCGSIVLSNPSERVADFLARVGAAGITHISGTASHWRRALMSGACSSMVPRYVRLSGEIADQAILDALHAAYPNASVEHAFATTEAGLAFEVGDGLAGFPASLVGAPGASVELKIAAGTLRVRSAGTAIRYLSGQTTSLRDSDGFVDTGDRVELRNGRYYFLGRSGGVINVGGLKVHPEEVEAVINSHPRVRMSRVMARRSPITGAVVSAEIVLADLVGVPAPEDVLKHEIIEHCQRSLASHKVPAIIRFVASLEVSAAGKLVRPNA